MVQLDLVGVTLNISTAVGQRFTIMPFSKGEGVLEGLDDMLVGWRIAITSSK